MPFENYRQDIHRAAGMRVHGERASWRVVFACLASPGMQAVTAYRLGSWLRSQQGAVRTLFGPLRVVLGAWVRIAWGIEIDRGATIGPGLYVGHFGGITVGPHVVAGANLTLSQGVTIGVSGSGERRGSPAIGDDVYIAAGAKVFGAIHVGHNVKIGANAVVHEDVPDHAVVALVPGFQIVSMKGNRPRADNVAPMPRRAQPRRPA